MLGPANVSDEQKDARVFAAPKTPRHELAISREAVRQWGGAVVLVVAIVGALAWVLPKATRNPLVETTIWSLVVTTSFAGWGSLVAFVVARRERVDLGLRIAWGGAAVCFVGGLLMAMALMARTMSLVLVDIGIALAIAEIFRARERLAGRLRFLTRIARRDPRVAMFAVIVGLLLVFQYLGGIADWHTNPYDDEIAYLAFVKKLLDTGTVIEPFSLRRLAALGGQTLFLDLVSLRAAPSQAHTFDRSICLLMVVLLVLGHRTRGRRAPLGISLLLIVMFLTLQNVAINTASYYSGMAFFLALFRTLTWADDRVDRDPVRTAVPIALVSATICTLRQNYIAVPPLVLAVSYGFWLLRSSGSPLPRRLAEPIACAALSLMALVPWFVVSWQSNRTFLYPVMLGTANPAMLLEASGSTALRELRLLVRTLLAGFPIHVLSVFAVAAVLVRERGTRIPMSSLGLGSMAALAMLVHSLSQSDAETIGRYASGFVVAFALAVVLTAASAPMARLPSPELRRAQVAIGVALFAILTQIVDSQKMLYGAYAKHFENIESLARSAPRSDLTNPPEVGRYIALQTKIPAGAAMAVMLDEPYLLDFARNPIWNLDMPGYSSLPPGLPYFEGPERVEEYFKGLGVRYLAFVRPGFSRYHYRREYWMTMLVDDTETWRAHGPYLIDFYDNLVRLEAKHGSLSEDETLAVVDLERSP
jgi:hypothetical protein